MAAPSAHRAWQRLSGTAFGRWLFTRLVCFKAPYFGSIRPVFEILEPGRAAARMRKRRAVTNHIGTVHAIAMANLCELVAGTLTEVSIPQSMRWIPRGMQIDYLRKAPTDVRAEGRFPEITEGEAQDVVVSVDVTDAGGNVVVHADITMYVSPRKD
ncbi:MAG: hotdog fold domain-containing protein [Woeseiaceae bacterium]|nr:hotdog fold domain-containing protein [Woeseiaceae bacterium]